jgi:hypothetical protein
MENIVVFAAIAIIAIVGFAVWKGLDKSDDNLDGDFVPGQIASAQTRESVPVTFWSIVWAIVVANFICGLIGAVFWFLLIKAVS